MFQQATIVPGDVFIRQYWWLLILVVAWSLWWKGLALWQAAGKRERGWFSAILIVNTFGLLEIFYLYVLPWFRRQSHTHSERHS